MGTSKYCGYFSLPTMAFVGLLFGLYLPKALADTGSMSESEPPMLLRESRLLLLDGSSLALAKSAVSTTPQFTEALDNLLQWADQALLMQAMSVTQNSILPLSGNSHDYFSVGPYWWPDPNQKDGLPWINRDGQVNPMFRDNDSDTKLFQQLLTSVRTLALAYYFSDKQEYADKALALLQSWFIEPQTKMNPHLNFAQSIPGRTNGRGIGIIDWRGLPYLLDAMTLLQNQQTMEFQQGMDEWLTIFLGWLIESKNGQDESAMHNNHGTYHDVIVTSLALYLDFDEVAKATVHKTQQRIISQIATDGAQEHELKRTKPFHYSVFNLLAMSQMATLADKVGVNLWQFPTVQQPRIYQAYEFIFNNIHNAKLWPGSQEKSLNIEDLVGISLIFKRQYELPDHLTERLTPDSDIALQAQQCGLLFNQTFSFETNSASGQELCLY